MARNGLETVDDRFGVFDRLQCFYSVQIVGKNRNRIWSIYTQKLGKFQK